MTRLRGLFLESTEPDPDNAGVGKTFLFPPQREVFFMDEELNTTEVVSEEETQKNGGFAEFFKKFGYLFAALSGLLALLFLFAPILTYENADEVTVTVNLIYYFQYYQLASISMFITIGLIICGIIFEFFHKSKINFDVLASLCFIIAVPMLVLSREFFADLADGANDVSISWGLACSLIFLVIAIVLSLAISNQRSPMTARDIAEDGVLIAVAFGLNFIKIPLGATGGSINFQMLPLFLIALRHGPSHGLICGGIVYGLLTCLTDGWGFATYPFDYLIGFGSIAILGFFKNQIFSEKQNGYNVKGELFLLLGGVLATAMRFIGSTASSIIIYGYTLEAAAAYNALYIPISGLVAIAVIMALYGPLAKLNNLYPVKKSV